MRLFRRNLFSLRVALGRRGAHLPLCAVQLVASSPDVEPRVLFDRAWDLADRAGSCPAAPRLAWIAVSVELPLTVADARELVAAALARDSSISAATRKVRAGEIDRFWRAVDHRGVRLVRGVTAAIVEEFVQGAARSGRRWGIPAGSTQRNRRAAVRHVFEVLRGVGFDVGDPTLDIDVVEVRCRRVTPVSDAVMGRLEAAAPHELVESRRAVVLALAQAGATNTEMTRVVVSDVDLVAGTVSLPGGTRVDPRTNELTPWGATVLRDVLANDNDCATSLLGVASASAAATVSNTISDLCQAAAVRPRVSVESIRAWRARCLFDATGSIQTVARFLGTRSLDVACDVVGYEWRATA
jgi:site-specific recombinase XerD